MSIFFEILVRIANYGPQIDQSRGENRLSHTIMDLPETKNGRGCLIPTCKKLSKFYPKLGPSFSKPYIT